MMMIGGNRILELPINAEQPVINDQRYLKLTPWQSQRFFKSIAYQVHSE
jgi:hypothetical protein